MKGHAGASSVFRSASFLTGFAAYFRVTDHLVDPVCPFFLFAKPVLVAHASGTAVDYRAAQIRRRGRSVSHEAIQSGCVGELKGKVALAGTGRWENASGGFRCSPIVDRKPKCVEQGGRAWPRKRRGRGGWQLQWRFKAILWRVSGLNLPGVEFARGCEQWFSRGRQVSWTVPVSRQACFADASVAS